MLIGIIIGAIGEEIGWRSFLQPFLEKKNSVLIASVLVGCIWGLWHIGHYKNGLLFMVGFLLFTISASIIIAWLLRGTQYNLIIATVFHIAVNLGFVLFFKNSLTDAKLIIINGIIWFIPAIIIVLINGKYFFKLKLSTARKGNTRLKKPNFHNRRRAQRCLRFLSADSEKFCPFGQVQPFRTAAGNATLACGYENQAHSG
jgi:hypothetical protein